MTAIFEIVSLTTRGIRQKLTRCALVWALPLLGLAVDVHSAQAGVIDAYYAGAYTITELGSPPGVPQPLGGLAFLPGSPNTLLIGGSALDASGAILAVELTRDGLNHVTGFVPGSTTLYALAPNIDGGLQFGPGGVLFYTGYPTNQLGQIKPGSTSPDKVISLSGAGSVGALAFVPLGYPGAGSFKLADYFDGGFYDTTLTSDGTGTFDVTSKTLINSPDHGPEGIAYVPLGAPLFPNPSLLLAEYDTGTISAYQLDAQGNPIVGTRSPFVTGLTGAEGAVVDPLTGDLLFSTFGGGDHLEVVQGFAAPTPEPASLLLAGMGGLGLFGYAFRRKHKARATDRQPSESFATL